MSDPIAQIAIAFVVLGFACFVVWLLVREPRRPRAAGAGPNIPPTRCDIPMPPVTAPAAEASDPWPAIFQQFPIGCEFTYLGQNFVRVVGHQFPIHPREYEVGRVFIVPASKPGALICHYRDARGVIRDLHLTTAANLLSLFPPERPTPINASALRAL